MTPRTLHDYAVLDLIEHERDMEIRKAFHEASERNADYRAGLISAMVLNVNRADKDDKLWEAADFFPHLKPPKEIAAALPTDAEPGLEPGMMSTAQTVSYVRGGFSLFVPR